VKIVHHLVFHLADQVANLSNHGNQGGVEVRLLGAVIQTRRGGRRERCHVAERNQDYRESGAGSGTQGKKLTFLIDKGAKPHVGKNDT